MVNPEQGMKIRWQNFYYPHGEWLNDRGERVEISSGFRATFGSIKLIVMMDSAASTPGHGDPVMTALRPSFIDESSLERVDVADGFITIV